MQEDRKSDYADYVKAGVALSGRESRWGNEYIDIRKKNKLGPLIRNRMKRAVKYGCDGVEVDSLGVYTHVPDIITKDDSLSFAKFVAEIGHNEGIAVGLKNVPSLAKSLASTFEFAVNESCAEYNECINYTEFTRLNKPVFIVHYKERGNSLSGSSLKKLIEKQSGHRFTCVLSDNKKLQQSVTNYDCDTGAIRKGSSKKPEDKTTTVQSATKTDSKQDPTNADDAKSSTPGSPGSPEAQNVPGAPGAPGAEGPKEVNAIVNEVDNNKGSSVGAALAIFTAGGVATAAVVGFVFLKKNKKYTDDDVSIV